MPARIEAMGNTLSDVMTSPSAFQQPSQVVTRYIDRETNASDVEVRTQREETRIANLSSNEVIISNDRDTQMPTCHSGLSSYDTEITGGSPIGTHTTEMIPQLDGPTSVHTRRRILENVGTEPEIIQRSTVVPGGGYPNESDSNSHDNRRPHDRRRPSGRRRYQDRSGRPLDTGSNHYRDYSKRGRPPDGNGGPPDDGGPSDGNGGPPHGGGPPDNGGPPDDGGPPRNG